MPQVALSSHLAHMLPELPEQERNRVIDTLEKIHRDQFDSGLRVKKLQSRPGVAVWEARVDSAARLLFTYGRHADRHTTAPVLTAHCWTVVFDHDDVPRVVRRKQFDVPDAMQWILADEVDACTWTDAPPDNPAADLDAIENDFPDTNRWEAYAALSSEYESTLQAPPENLPWYLKSLTAFSAWVEGKEIPAELVLSDEQIQLLREPLPIFLNGPAGSGKTTLALYRLLVMQENDPDADVAFITHNPRLMRHAEDLYNALPTRPEGATPVTFQTYQELAAETIGLTMNSLQYCQARREQLRDFLGRHPLSHAEQQLYETDIWAVIKGMLPLQRTPARASDVRGLLPRSVYCHDMPDAWSAVPREQRADVYRLARQYQDMLNDNNRLDAQDIATQALRRLLSESVPRRYDALVLDEVQDLTEKQLRVALATLRKGSRTQMLLAGDPTQVLGGSGFGWRMPRAIFHERGWDVPNPYTLRRSYRASAPTLRLPQALAELLKKEHADVVALNPDEARSRGRPPLQVAPGDAVNEALAEGHPDVLILTATEEEAARLREEWGHPLVWAVSDAKGLEAEHVVLYQLPDRLLDRPGAAPAEREAAQQANRQTLRLHYVAATRARRSITAVVDPHPAGSLWDTDTVAGTVNTIAQFQAPWDGNPTQEEWEKRAVYYRDREHWQAAAECYRKAGRAPWAALCEALNAIMSESADASAEAPPCPSDDLRAVLEEHPDLTDDQAAFLLSYSFVQHDAPLRIHLLRQAGRPDEADAAQARYDAETGNLRAAAAYYEANDRFAEAAQLYEKGEAWISAADCYRRVERWRQAAVCYQHGEAWLDAATLYRRAGADARAARCFARAEAWTDAAACHRATGAWTRAATCYEKAGDDRAAASCYRRLKRWEAASERYSRAGDDRWAAACRALAEHTDADAQLRAIRRHADELPQALASFLLDERIDRAATDELLIAWLYRQANAMPPDAMRLPPIGFVQEADCALTYSGGGWYEITRWNPETGIEREKVQGAGSLPDALQPLAPDARAHQEQTQRHRLSF